MGDYIERQAAIEAFENADKDVMADYTYVIKNKKMRKSKKWVLLILICLLLKKLLE